MKTNNKKKFVMITAMFLMIALVVGMGAMTYARYTTTENTEKQSATAAKWGVVINVNATELFGKEYENKVIVESNANNDIITAGEKAVVAPGSSGSMTITIDGLTEVRAKLSFTEVVTTSDIYLDEYYPVKWTLTKNGNKLVDGVKLSEVMTALSNATYTYAANTTIDDEYTISWVWELDTGATADEIAENSVKDTAIGMLANGESIDAVNTALSTGYTDSSHTISFQLKVTVEQTQE